MFKKRLVLKKVRRYPTPAYPVLDAGEVLFAPREFRIGEMVRDLARPVMPLVLTTAALTQVADAAPSGRPAAAAVAGRTAEPGASIATRIPVQEESDHPYRIRRFSEEEIAQLLKDLKMSSTARGAIKGKVALREILATEAQGREVLDRFFAKNGLRFRHDVEFSRGDVDFEIDAYDAKRKIGYEYSPSEGEKDLDGDEAARLKDGIKGEHVLFVRGPKGLYDGRRVIEHLQRVAEDFLRRLYAEDALGRGKEIRKHIRDLSSGAEKARAAASGALREIGGEAVWFLRDAIRSLEKMEPYAVDREELQAQRRRLDALVKTIYEEKVEPLLERLDDPTLERREEAADLLLEMGPGVHSWIRDWREKARREDNAEVVQWCDRILKGFGD